MTPPINHIYYIYLILEQKLRQENKLIMTTYLVYDDIYLEHDTGMHPENALRLQRTIQYLQQSPLWNKLILLKPRRASIEEITNVHSLNYVKSIETVSKNGGGYWDADTYISPRSYEVAMYAAGGVLAAIDRVVEEQNSNAFCLVRPPGHHARPSQAMGFCLFNNIALGARYLQKKYNLNRIVIIDWDLHHGNGTQEIFYQDDSVLFISLHRYPYYPGTGGADEIGSGKGKGFTLNIPLDYLTDSSKYLASFEQVLLTAESFRPDFILVSAGFDTYKYDPLGGLGLDIEDFYTLTKKTKSLAEKVCHNRLISVLEGGYSLNGMPRCIEAHLNGLL